jgi:hypothetical protein
MSAVDIRPSKHTGGYIRNVSRNIASANGNERSSAGDLGTARPRASSHKRDHKSGRSASVRVIHAIVVALVS